MSFNVKAYAKINLSLDVLSKQNNGLHLIESIIQPISLHDIVTLEKSSSISCSCNSYDVPSDENNLAFKAAKVFFDYTKINGGISINIDKKIPTQAGLGGGSSDAAVVLKSLNEIYNANLSLNELTYLSSLIGSDVASFIFENTVLVSGFGEKITVLPKFFKLYILIAKPNFSMSTKLAYDLLDSMKIKNRPNTKMLVDALKNNDKETFLSGLVNVFEEIYKNDEVSLIKKTMNNFNCLSCHLTGSGSCIFGIFDNLNQAQKCKDNLSSYNFLTFLTEPI